MNIISELFDEDGRRLSDLIERTHELAQISHESQLPQIVVIGERSSGKSSVLRAVFNLSLQIPADLCTRFVIEIAFRRSKHASTVVNIVPDPAEPFDEAKKQRIDTFEVRWSRTDISNEEHTQTMIEEAREAMGLHLRSGYSGDRLVIQIQGPTQHHLTLIDLPGFTWGHHSEMRKAESIAKKYLSGKRTIILAVTHSLNDNKDRAFYALEQKYWDKSIGVITAPDMINWNSRKGAFIKAGVSLSPIQPASRWHVVRNLSSEEIQNGLVRDEVESKFFADKIGTLEWQGMENVSYGIVPLRQQLGKLLAEKIAACLPDVHRRIDQATKRMRIRLSRSNNKRIEMIRQNQHLTAMIVVLKERLQNYSLGESDDLEIGSEAATLRDQIRNANKCFVDLMVNKGHTWEIGNIDESDLFLNNPTIPLDFSTFKDNEPYRVSLNALLSYFALFTRQDHYPWFTTDSSLIIDLFLQQSDKWANYMREYTRKVFDIVEFKVKLLILSLTDKSTGSCVFDQVIQPHLKRQYDRLLEKVQELVMLFRCRQSSTSGRHCAAAPCNEKMKLSTRWKAIEISEEWDIQTQAGANVYNCTQLYYRIALNVLMDHVENLGIERMLLMGLEDILTPESLSDVETTDIISPNLESPELSREKTLLEKRLCGLAQAQSLILTHKLQMHLNNGDPSLSPCQPSPTTPPRASIQVSDCFEAKTPQHGSLPAVQDAGSSGHQSEGFESSNSSRRSTPSTISEISTPKSSRGRLQKGQRNCQACGYDVDFNKDKDVFIDTDPALVILST